MVLIIYLRNTTFLCQYLPISTAWHLFFIFKRYPPNLPNPSRLLPNNAAANETQYVKINKTNICDECCEGKANTPPNVEVDIILSVCLMLCIRNQPCHCMLSNQVEKYPYSLPVCYSSTTGLTHTNHLGPLRLEFHRRGKQQSSPTLS